MIGTTWGCGGTSGEGRLSLRFPSTRRRADTGRTCLAPLGRISPRSTGLLAGRGRVSNSASSSSPGHPPLASPCTFPLAAAHQVGKRRPLFRLPGSRTSWLAAVPASLAGSSRQRPWRAPRPGSRQPVAEVTPAGGGGNEAERLAALAEPPAATGGLPVVRRVPGPSAPPDPGGEGVTVRCAFPNRTACSTSAMPSRRTSRPPPGDNSGISPGVAQHLDG